MELQEFLKRYLPDYQKKVDEHYEGIEPESELDKWLLCEFFEKHFLEVLQNFTDKICEEQRNYCLGGLDDSVSDRIWDEVKNAKQPEIE